MNEGTIIYQFSRIEVDRGDFLRFLSLYRPDKLPTSHRLREMMNSLIFCVEGYDHDPREIHIVPEVRGFYTAFHEAWPYWLYFCNLDTENLKTMVLCCLPSLTVMKVDGKPNVAMEYRPLELLRFVSNDFGPMNVMCEQAGLSERLIYDRSKAVFEYFDMPFNAEPPSA